MIDKAQDAKVQCTAPCQLCFSGFCRLGMCEHLHGAQAVICAVGQLQRRCEWVVQGDPAGGRPHESQSNAGLTDAGG